MSSKGRKRKGTRWNSIIAALTFLKARCILCEAEHRDLFVAPSFFSPLPPLSPTADFFTDFRQDCANPLRTFYSRVTAFTEL